MKHVNIKNIPYLPDRKIYVIIESMFYGKIFKALSKARVKYVIAGGVAVVLHGYRRTTDDLDLYVLLEEKNLGRFFDALSSAGYSPKAPVTKEQFKSANERAKWKKEKGMVVFSFVENDPPFKLIDMFVNEPIKFTEVYKKKTNVKLEGVTVPTISIDHLIQLKKQAGRDRDKNDILNLKEIKRISKQ